HSCNGGQNCQCLLHASPPSLLRNYRVRTPMVAPIKTRGVLGAVGTSMAARKKNFAFPELTGNLCVQLSSAAASAIRQRREHEDPVSIHRGVGGVFCGVTRGGKAKGCHAGACADRPLPFARVCCYGN